jgi:class 3 adenylate cyclase/tetratricopeptide (TPR) repeat protein
LSTVETLTILFTDVVGSTALRTDLGDDRADELFGLHDNALRAALAMHRGREIKHTGDGMMAVFESSSDAVACAIAMHNGVARATHRGGGLLRLRVGVSAGDVTTTGEDCFGIPVNEAARLGAAAQPGEILVTEIVRLLAGSRGAFAFGGETERDLKGLGSVTTWSVEWSPEPPGAPLPAALMYAPRVRFVGREAETALFVDAWTDVANGGHDVLLVAGEPGVGKSRFAAERAWTVHAEGATVLLGRCEEGVAAPYRPFAETVRQLVDSESLELDVWARTHGPHIDPLLPDVRDRFVGVVPAAESDPETEQLRLFDAVVALFGEATVRVPLLLVLDDLHWADRPSLLLLRHLVRSEALKRLLVLGMYRETDLDRSHPLASLLADLRSDERTTRVLLRGLDEVDTRTLVESWSGGDIDDDFVRAVHRETEGNPFFVHQVLTHLAESGAATRRSEGWVVEGPIDRLGIPEGVREVVGRRLSRLGDSTNRLLGVASVIGREFALDLLCTVSDVDEDEALDALEPAINARLVEEAPGAPGRFAFTHALVRSTLADELLTLRRVRLHQRIGEAIEALPERHPGAHVAELAYHFTEAAAGGDVTKAVRYTLQLANSLATTGELATAQASFERALQLLDDAGDPDQELRFDALVGLARVLSGGPDPREAWAPIDGALTLARRLDSLEHLTRALRFMNSMIGAEEPNRELRATIDDLLATMPPGDLANRARLLATRGTLYSLFRPTDAELHQAEGDVREAIRLATDADLPDTVASASLTLSNLLGGSPRVTDGLEAAESAIRAALETGDTRVLAFGYLRAARAHMQRGDRQAMDAALAAATELPITRHAANTAGRFLAQTRAATAMLEGRFDDATRVAYETADHAHYPGWGMMLFVQGELIRLQQGRLNPDVLDRVAVQWPQYFAIRSAAALVYAERGEREEAKRRLEQITDEDFAIQPRRADTPLLLSELAELCAHVGDTSRAAILHQLLVPYDGQLLTAYGGASCVSAAARALGQLEVLLGRLDQAEVHFEAAIHLEQGFGAHALVARTRYWYARMLEQRASPADARRAGELLDLTLVETQRLGMHPLHKLAEVARPAS